MEETITAHVLILDKHGTIFLLHNLICYDFVQQHKLTVTNIHRRFQN